MTEYILKTDRLGLRNWCDDDIAPFHAMSNDPEVMRFFPKTLSMEETESFIARMQRHFAEHGFCYFAVDVLETSQFIGMTGLLHQDFESDYTPCVDIGWRLQRDAWGRGFATEGAQACLDFAFNRIGLKEVYSFAPLTNTASEVVMKKIGMQYLGQFRHPRIMDYPAIRDCVVYKKEG